MGVGNFFEDPMQSDRDMREPRYGRRRFFLVITLYIAKTALNKICWKNVEFDHVETDIFYHSWTYSSIPGICRTVH